MGYLMPKPYIYIYIYKGCCFNAVKVRLIFTTKAAFYSIHKDVLPIFNQSLLIYKLKCWCNSTYIGRTSQRLDVRVRQHVPRGILNTERITSGHSQATDSAIVIE